MNKRALRADFLLILTAAIWGFGFVAQRHGMEFVGPFTFNGIRFLLGALSLLPLILIRRKKSLRSSASFSESRRPPVGKKLFFLASLAAGGCIFIGVFFQQFGLLFTTAGNAGFITGLYVVLTPIFAIFLGRKTGPATWIGSVLTFSGLYFVSVAGRPSINPGDILIIFGSLFWAVHVLLIDWLMQRQKRFSIDPIELSSGQFAVCGTLSMLGAIFAESHVSTIVERINPALLEAGLFGWLPFPELVSSLIAGTTLFSMQAAIPILYGGLVSVGIAYTLQVIAQRDAPPAHATIILCFEGCFAALGGILLLGERAGAWTLLGFGFMLAGMLATQWEVIGKARKLF